MFKKIILFVLIVLLSIWLYIEFFSLWKSKHDIQLVSLTIRNTHLKDIYNINEINYYQIPWGINIFELRALELLNISDLSDITENEIFNESYTFTNNYSNNFIVEYNFNEVGQLYRVYERIKSSDGVDISSEGILTNFEENDLNIQKNIDNLYLANCVTEVTWIDELQKVQKRTLDNAYSFKQIYEEMDLYKDEDFSKLIFYNDLILKRKYKYNSTTIEHILKKYDQTSLLTEFIFINEKLQ